jgi:hypothetical protein
LYFLQALLPAVGLLTGGCAVKADLNNDGVIDEKEYEIYLERLRREMEDEDAKRDSQRQMAWFSLSGMLLFPFSVVATESFGLSQASNLLSTMSNIYYVSIAAIVASYFGFSNMKKGESK